MQIGKAATSPISDARRLADLGAMAEHIAHFKGLMAGMASRAASLRCVAAEQQVTLANVQAVTADAANWMADMEVGD